MSREHTGAGDTGRIGIGPFRRCLVSDDKVQLTHPLIFGSGFVFDRSQQTVTIRRCLLGWTLFRVEIPFSQVKKVNLVRLDIKRGPYGGQTQDVIQMSVGHEKTFTVWIGAAERSSDARRNKERAERILAAIQRMMR